MLTHLDPLIEHLTVDGEEMDTTPEHPFYTDDNGWVPAGELRIGEQVRQADGGSRSVTSIAVVEQPQWMYNLTVDTAHTFFAGNRQLLVHNVCEDPSRNPKQDKLLTTREIIRLQQAGFDVHAEKVQGNASSRDLYKDRDGNIYVKPRGGAGYGEPTGWNINDVP